MQILYENLLPWTVCKGSNLCEILDWCLSLIIFAVSFRELKSPWLSWWSPQCCFLGFLTISYRFPWSFRMFPPHVLTTYDISVSFIFRRTQESLSEWKRKIWEITWKIIITISNSLLPLFAETINISGLVWWKIMWNYKLGSKSKKYIWVVIYYTASSEWAMQVRNLKMPDIFVKIASSKLRDKLWNHNVFIWTF